VKSAAGAHLTLTKAVHSGMHSLGRYRIMILLLGCGWSDTGQHFGSGHSCLSNGWVSWTTVGWV